MNIPKLIEAAVAYDHGDARRIQHFLKVYAYADLIGQLEHLPADTQEILVTAAVLHDIGIHAAEEKYGSSSGKYQELEGPAIARKLLEPFSCSPSFTGRVCWLIGHHHTYTGIDGPDYQILLEADYLVNAGESSYSRENVQHMLETVFQTESGIRLLKSIYLR